jgi:NO-binding membrane sensor protein with MHYT domain
MAESHEFTYGWVIPAFGYALSLLGALVGFGCVARARRASTRPRRLGLVTLGAWSIGGIALWSMHFVTMIGFTVTGTAIRYDAAVAARGLAAAVAAAWVGLGVLAFGRMRLARVLTAGLLAGLALAGAHLADVRAMRVEGDVTAHRWVVAASFAVAVVLSATALWWGFVVGGRAGRFVASAVTAVAACCAHYIGMAALQVRVHPDVSGAPDLPGLSVNLFLAPVVLNVATVAIALAYLVVAGPERDRERGAERVVAYHMSAPVVAR